MAVQGDELWNSVMKGVEAEANQQLQDQATSEMQKRQDTAAGLDASVGGQPVGDLGMTPGQGYLGGAAIKDALTSAVVGAEQAGFQTKDFVTTGGGLLGNPPAPQDRSAYRQATDQAQRELKALSGWNDAIRGVSQFVTGLVGAGKLTGWKNSSVAGSMGNAAVASAVALDPAEERLSNFVQSYPSLQNPVTEFLAAKPEDSKAAGRLKNVAESLLLDGVAATAVVAGARVVKALRAGDKVAAEAALKELDDANVKLAAQEAEWYRKSFIDEQTTAAAQQDLLHRSITAAEPQGGLNKNFLGDTTVPATTQAPAPMGGRAAALDAEMRSSQVSPPEVPGASAPDVPTAPAAATPEAAPGGRAAALQAEMQQAANNAPEVPGATTGVDNAAAAPGAPTGGSVPPGAGGGTGVGLPSDVRAAGHGALDAPAPGGVRQGVEQVPSGEARGMRATGEPTRLPAIEVTPEQTAKVVQRMATRDAAAVSEAGSVEAALQDGHRFSGSELVPWQKLYTPEDVRQFVNDMVDLNAEAIVKMKGGNAAGVLGDTQVEKLAGQMGRMFETDPHAIMGMLQAAGNNARAMAAQMEVGFRIANAAFIDNYQFLKRLEAGNLQGYATREEALLAFRDRTRVALDIFGNARSLLSNSGRTLRRARSEFQIRADQMARVNLEQMDPEALAKLFLTTDGDPAAMAKALKPGIINQIVDWATLMRTANVLWGWSTQVVNTATSAAMLAWRPLTVGIGARAMEGYAALTHNDILANQARIMRNRAKVEIVSTASTISDGLQALKAAFKTGDSIMAPHASTEAFTTVAGGVGGDLGQVTNMLPWRDFKTIDDVIANGIKALTFLQTADLRAMGAADEMIKTMRYRGVLMGRASVEADALGLKPGSQAYKDYLKAKADAGFDSAGRAIDAEALQEARVSTFQQDLRLDPQDVHLGDTGLTLGATASNFMANYPVAKLVVPFIKTPSNLFRYGVKMTPGLNLLQREYTNALRGAHGLEAQARAMGEMAMGVMLMAAGIQLRLQDKITGSGPRDPKQKQTWAAEGNMPYAINMGQGRDGKQASFQINRFDPIQFPVALAADFVDMMMISQNKGDHWVEGAAQAAVLALAHQLKDKTYYKGASDFLDALGDDKKLRTWSERFAPGFVPGAALLKSVNPDPYVHEVNGLFDSIKATLPGYSDSVPKRIDVWGNPVTVPGRFTASKDYNSPLTKALDEMYSMTGTALTPPSPNVDGVDIREITLKNGRNAYEYYAELSGKPGGLPLKTRLEQIVQSDTYKAAPHGDSGDPNTKEGILTKDINSYRKRALDRVKMEDAGFRELISAKARDTFNKAMAGKKELHSVEAAASARAVNDMLATYGISGSIPVPKEQPVK